MELYIIEGPSNSGKSTLIRCLTGVAKGSYLRTPCQNVIPLFWGGVVHETLILTSSINEGNGNRIIDPDNFQKFLDEYENRIECPATRAIIALNSTLRNRPITNYVNRISGVTLAGHPVGGVVTLGLHHGQIANALNCQQPLCQTLPPANATTPPIRNVLASQVRTWWGLT